MHLLNYLLYCIVMLRFYFFLNIFFSIIFLLLHANKRVLKVRT